MSDHDLSRAWRTILQHGDAALYGVGDAPLLAIITSIPASQLARLSALDGFMQVCERWYTARYSEQRRQADERILFPRCLGGDGKRLLHLEPSDSLRFLLSAYVRAGSGGLGPRYTRDRLGQRVEVKHAPGYDEAHYAVRLLEARGEPWELVFTTLTHSWSQPERLVEKPADNLSLHGSPEWTVDENAPDTDSRGPSADAADMGDL